MWFKQIQLFEINNSFSFSPQQITEKLEPLIFKPCLPSMFSSMGWVTPFDNDNGPLIHVINGNIMLCLQIEEKILPATVIRHALSEKIKKIQMEEDRRVKQQEKLSLKDEIILTLLPRAFTKFTRFYAYIDIKNNWLVLNTINKNKSQAFISMFKKSIIEDIRPLDLNKLSPIITHWLKNQNYPNNFSIEKSCLLQDPNQQNKIIRCQQQNLFVPAIQSFIKEGYEVKQLALSWYDRVNFILTEDFLLSGIKFQDEIISQANESELETPAQQFDADFVIMAETLSVLLNELLNLFKKENKKQLATSKVEEAA